MSETRGGTDALAIAGAAALGAVIGAAAALLLAPKAGAELRDELRASAQSAADKIQSVAEQVTGQVRAVTGGRDEQPCEQEPQPQTETGEQ